jgi:hypothetical protein
MPDVPLITIIEHLFFCRQGMWVVDIGGGGGWLSAVGRSQATGACATTGWCFGGGWLATRGPSARDDGIGLSTFFGEYVYVDSEPEIDAESGR